MTFLDDLVPTFDRLVDDGHLAGWVAGTSDGTGSTIRHGGRRALDGDTMTAETQFALSSTTKPLGGALALRLVEQGIVALDDPIGR